MIHQFEKDLLLIKSYLDCDNIAQNIYAALCNNDWQSIKEPTNIYSCSWRYAGGLIADLRGKHESYLDYYCSGILDEDNISEGETTEQVRELLLSINWIHYSIESPRKIFNHNDIYYIFYPEECMLDIFNQKTKKLKTISDIVIGLIYLKKHLPNGIYTQITDYIFKPI